MDAQKFSKLARNFSTNGEHEENNGCSFVGPKMSFADGYYAIGESNSKRSLLWKFTLSPYSQPKQIKRNALHFLVQT